MSPVPTQGVYDFDGEDYSANPNKYDDGVMDGLPLFGLQELLHDMPLVLAEVKRLREENETLRKVDWEYECLWTWLAENTNLLNTIEPLMEEWKKEYDEE